MLDEIKALYECGRRDEAFELLELYLGEYQDDIEAQVLKVSLCLELDRDPAYVGVTLARLGEVPERRDVKALRMRAEERVRNLLQDGRSDLRGRDWRDALQKFKSAVELLK